MTETEKRRIFVIDDDQADCDLIAQTLDYKEFEIITINDLESAVQKAGDIKPDLIFVSLSLSWAPVSEAIKSIQSYKGMKKVPFIALTSLPGDLNTLYAGTMGIVDVLEKPINTDELISKTLNILGEDLISLDKGSLFEGFSVKSEPQETPLEENIIKTDQEPVISQDKPQETFFDKDPVETEETEQEPVNIKSTASDAVKYKDHEPGNEKEFWGEIDYKHSEKRKDIIKNRLFIFIVLLISVGIGVRLLFLTDTDEKMKKVFSGDISKTEAPSSGGDLKSEGVDKDKSSSGTYPDTYLIESPEDERPLRGETFTETMPAEEMEIESKILSPDDTGTAINSTRTKRRVPPKSDFLKPALEEPEKEGTYTEALFPDGMETGSEFPSAVEDTFEETMAPAADTDSVNSVKEKRRQVPPKSDFLKKATYSIQIGAYRVENNAISKNDTLKEKGYHSFIKKETSDGSPLFKVMVGKYETRDKAEAEKRILRQKEGISSFILAY